MNEQKSLVQNQQEHATASTVPWLVVAPRLVRDLGWVMALASTREVARIKLTTESLESTDLSTNMALIADQGQNAFLDAYSDLLDIGAATRSMARDHGYFDRLENAFGEPHGDRAVTRALQRICETIDECDRNGRRTAKLFADWRDTVQKVRRAVIATQRHTQAGIGKVDGEMTTLGNEYTLQQVSQQRTEQELQSAKEEYEKVTKIHEKREKKLMQYADFGVGCATLGFTFGMVGALVATTGSAAMVAFSSKKASTLEEQLQRKQQESHELEMRMQKVQNALEGYKDEKKKLEEMMSIIVGVCVLLQGLCSNIVELLAGFKLLNSVIKELVNEHKDIKGTIKDAREDLQDAEDDGRPAVMSETTKLEFLEQVHGMRKLSVRISSMSNLYAQVIAEAITPGFSKVVEAAYDEFGGTDSAVIIHNKQKAMEKFTARAEEMCFTKEREEEMRLAQRLADIDAAYELKIAQRVKSGRNKKTAAGTRSDASQTNGGWWSWFGFASEQ